MDEICGRSTEYAESLSRLIQAETVSTAQRTNLDKFFAFHQLLRETFPAVFSAVSQENFGASFLLKWPGKNSLQEPVLFMSHHDVVEAGGGWSHQPFSGDIDDGKVWGRGTLDTKGNLWAMLQAAEELIDSGFVPERDVFFASGCNEETDGSGADAISRTLADRGVHFFMTLDEGGMILHEPVGGVHATFAMVGVAEKGCTDLRFTAKGNGGHASTPGKNTPLVRLGRFMAAADKAKIFRAEMSPVVQEMFCRMAPYMSGAMKFFCTHIRLFKSLMTKMLPVVSPAANAMLRTTLAFTMAKGSDGLNVLPQVAWVTGNMRFSHHQGRDGSIAAVKNLAQKYDVEVEILDPGFESPVTDYRSAPFRLVEQTVREVFPDTEVSPYIMTAASDSRFYGRVCRNCIRFAPFLITEQQMESIHGPDENIAVSALEPAVRFYTSILEKI